MLFLGSTGSTFSASGSGYHCIIIMLLLLGTPTSVSTATTTMSRCFSITCCSVVDPALWICPAVVDPSFCLSCNQIVFWCFSVQGLCSVFLSSPWLDSLIWASSGRCWFVPSRVCPPMMVPAVLPHPGSVAWGIHLASTDWQDIAVWHSDLLSIHLIPDLLRLKVIVTADPGGVDQGSAVLVGVPGRWPTADLTWVYCFRRRIQGHSGTGVSSVFVNLAAIESSAHACASVWKQTHDNCLSGLDMMKRNADILQPSCPSLRRNAGSLMSGSENVFIWCWSSACCGRSPDNWTQTLVNTLNFMQRVYFWIGLQYHTTVAQSWMWILLIFIDTKIKACLKGKWMSLWFTLKIAFKYLA